MIGQVSEESLALFLESYSLEADKLFNRIAFTDTAFYMPFQAEGGAAEQRQWHLANLPKIKFRLRSIVQSGELSPLGFKREALALLHGGTPAGKEIDHSKGWRRFVLRLSLLCTTEEHVRNVKTFLSAQVEF